MTNKYLVLCPLPLEIDAIVLRLKEQNHIFTVEQVGPLRVYHFNELNLLLSLAGHGKTQFGIQTQFLLNHYPKVLAVFCAGTAGGIDPKVSIFDLVIANKTIEHDFKIRFFKRPLPEFNADPKLLFKINELINLDNTYKTHIGIIASGDEDIIDQVRSIELLNQTGALAVAWEGAGGARACKFNSIPFLEIRGITDIATNSIPINFNENLKIVMSRIIDLVIKVIN